MSRRKKNQVIENVKIEKMAAEGMCIARLDEKVIFVEQVAPGDVVDLKVVRRKKKFLIARPTLFHQKSEDRREPFCDHFGTCGGCKWQHIDYSKQADYKREQVIDQLTRIAKVDFPEVNPILASKATRFYRGKMEYSATNMKWLSLDEIEQQTEHERRALGFHVPGFFDKVLDIDVCYLQADLSNKIRNYVRDYIIQNDLQMYDIRKNEGWLRTLTIRNTLLEQWMVIVSVTEKNQVLFGLLDTLKKEFPEITSLQYVINTKGNDTLYDLDIVTYEGKDFIEEQMEDLVFKIGPKSFFQTNSSQGLILYQAARKMAGDIANKVVYDLYTGTGTIACFMAKTASKVIGIESVPEAIEDAKINAERNNLNNTHFFAGDMKDVLTDDFMAEQGAPDVIIVDPPRAGLHAKVVEQICKVKAPIVVYISCNPATQARDLALMDGVYKVTEVQPVDMFPHTHHIENIVKLMKK